MKRAFGPLAIATTLLFAAPVAAQGVDDFGPYGY
jgi:hypothetical protein